jgi:lipopolysaccharide export system permease protein
MFVNFSFFKYQLLFGFFLASVLVAYNIRERREHYAIFANGISIGELLKPIFFMSAFLSVIALVFSVFVVPYSNRERANFITVNVKRYFLESIHPKNFSKISGDTVIYAEKKEEKKIKNLFIYMQKNGWTITAEEARFEGTNLILKNGFIQIPQKEGFDILMFKKYLFSIDVKYIKKYSFEDLENKKLFDIVKKKGKDSFKAIAILTDRFSFFIPFLFLGMIGFLLGIRGSSSREGVLSTAIFISIGYLLINFLTVKMISTGKMPFYALPVGVFIYFYVIFLFLKRKSF